MFSVVSGLLHSPLRFWYSLGAMSSDSTLLPKLSLALVIVFVASMFSAAQAIPIKRIATGLQNPRGLAVLPDGRMLLAQAGTGYSSRGALGYTGRLSLLTDWNDDGDYDDAAEIIDVLDKLPSYNILYQSNPGRDEVIGIGDVLALDDGSTFFTLDDNFKRLAIGALSPSFERLDDIYVSDGSMNGIAYDSGSETIYIAESSNNAIGALSLSGEYRQVARFASLAHEQQPVPAGIAIDPTTGDLLVALFSGQLWVYYGGSLSYMPGDAKVVRAHPRTGAIRDEISGLTTAVDVAVDEQGQIYVAELTTRWPSNMIDQDFDLFAPDSPPDPGGYPRFSGRVSLYKAAGSAPIILADGLDQPTNLTYHDGALYVSVGQGSPGRRVWGEQGITRIIGEVYRIDLESLLR